MSKIDINAYYLDYNEKNYYNPLLLGLFIMCL
jgi:hypothetical protein